MAEDKQILTEAYDKLRGYLLKCAERASVELKGGIRTIASSEGHYYGLWPDDFLFPHIVCPELADKDKLQRIIEFLTESVVDLERVPDRVEPDGLPIMFPGWYDGPIGERMPAHLPAAWTRLLSYFEEWGVNIPKKERWAKVIKRSFEQISFSCGLVYIDPQRPYVGFGYQDNIAITGFTLMSSLAIYRGLWILKFKGIDTIKEAWRLRESYLEIEEEIFPEEESPIGFEVYSEGGENLGVVVDIISTPAHDVLLTDKDVLIPFVAEWIVAMFPQEKKIIVKEIKEK